MESVLTTSTFAELGVDQKITDALDAAGITSPFPIQSMCVPLALDGQDLIGQAKTGTGKTLGFGIPLLQLLNPDQSNRTPHALVVVPTRELCVQVARDLEVAGKVQGARVLAVYGGRSYEPQVNALAKGVDVVVGTPGRLMDLARQRKLILSDIQILVLDEADEMLDMGFLPDVETIVSMLPSKRQTLLFSATMPGQIVSLARRYMTSPTHIRASDPTDENVTVDSIEQHVWRAHSMDKPEIIARVLQADGRGLAIVFCRTKRNAQKLTDDLADRGFAVGTVHGDLGQGAREQALRAFRSGKIDVLVATDVAARGIDVDGVTHVFNYTCPEDEKTYLHRIGRTGRAGNSGVSVTLVDWDDVPRWGLINKALGLAFPDPIETYSTSQHVYTGLGIPKGTTGRLPKASRTRAGLDAETIEDLGETGAAAGRRSSGQGGRGGSSNGRGSDSRRSGSSSGGNSRNESGGSRSSDSGPGGSRTADADKATKPKRKRNRNRSRTRSGKPVSGNQAADNADAKATT
ncbi:MAG: superfamily II DNA/RNA helicase [Actinomycetes bacterium]|jgi:superfamily II DNA/RNA helicase